ncbi:MAG: hypothetical protein IT211_14255 [Armatimonadetes bacterium]|nr:hypothetical protein [Armatimonadota bacterium]
MGNEALSWGIATLTIAPALLVAVGYRGRGASIAALVAGAGLAALLLLDTATPLTGLVMMFPVVAVVIAGTQWRTHHNPEALSNAAFSWGKVLAGGLFCGVVGGALLAVVGNLDGAGGIVQQPNLPAATEQGTFPTPLRLFDADMLLLWVVAAVAVVVCKITIPTQQGTASADYADHQPIPHTLP